MPEAVSASPLKRLSSVRRSLRFELGAHGAARPDAAGVRQRMALRGVCGRNMSPLFSAWMLSGARRRCFVGGSYRIESDK